MKKWLLLLVALVMSVSCACAESATVTVYDFGDFTMELPADIPVQYDLPEKADTEVWFTIYPGAPAGDTATNFNCLWVSDVMDLSAVSNSEVQAFAAGYQSQIVPGFEASGMKVTRFEMLDYGKMEIGGKPAIFFSISMTVNYGQMDLTMVMTQWMVSCDGGTYTFTGTAISRSDMDSLVTPLLDLISWK